MTDEIARTSAGLREALFSAMEKLRDGDMMADDAKAFAGLAKEISNTVRLEIEVAKLRNQYPSDAKNIVPTSLTLGEQAARLEKKP